MSNSVDDFMAKMGMTEAKPAPAPIEEPSNTEAVEPAPPEPTPEPIEGKSEEESGINKEATESDPQAELEQALQSFKVKAGGKELEISLDLNDIEAVRKTVEKATGAEHLTGKMGVVKKNFDKYKQTTEPQLKAYTDIRSAYKANGIAGLVDQIEGEGAFAKMLTEVQDRATRRATASESEQAILDREEKAERRIQEAEHIQRMVENQAKENEETREAAEVDKVQGFISSGLDKYQIADIDGEDSEYWSEQLNRVVENELVKIEEAGKPLSQKVIHTTIKKHVDRYNKMIAKQQTKAAEKAVETKEDKTARSLASAAGKVNKAATEANSVKKALSEGMTPLEAFSKGLFNNVKFK